MQVLEGAKGRVLAQGLVKYVVPGEEKMKLVLGEVVEKFSKKNISKL